MLLRRITKHINDQNWFAVFLDFIIVVVGVFIGIQVANWNEERLDRKTEYGLLVRLSEDVSNLLYLQQQDLDKNINRLMTHEIANPVMFSNQPSRELTAEECNLVAISHWMPPTADEMPSIDEIVAGGNMSLITDSKIKSLLQTFLVQRQRARTRYAESTNELFRLSNRHPEIIHFIRGEVGKGDNPTSWLTNDNNFKFLAKCDIEKIKGTKGFLNDYVDNLARLNSMVNAFRESIEILSELNTHLEILLIDLNKTELKQEPI